MIPDLDIYRSAQVLVKRHGEDASIETAKQADAMLEAGDVDGYAVWKRILRAVEELQGTTAKSGEAVPGAGEYIDMSVHIVKSSQEFTPSRSDQCAIAAPHQPEVHRRRRG